MNIFPINTEAAKKRHWVVRWLRAYAIIEVVLAVLVGKAYCWESIGAEDSADTDQSSD